MEVSKEKGDLQVAFEDEVEVEGEVAHEVEEASPYLIVPDSLKRGSSKNTSDVGMHP